MKPKRGEQDRTHRQALPPFCWRGPLYTKAEQQRRDETVWTLVQAVLAPIQFIVFLVSLVLVVRFLLTSEAVLLATGSVILKTLMLYAIMVTGSVWEKVVFGKYLFARPFFWEDVVSIFVVALHTLYLVALLADWWGVSFTNTRGQMIIALAAYGAYVVNAFQFFIKLQMAQRGRRGRAGISPPSFDERELAK